MKPLPKNVLVIDDSLTLRKFIEKSLATEDCVNHLLLAAEPATGLELARTTKPDLIICDYTLPGVKGDELCRSLARMPETSRIPVILMSSNGPEIGALSLHNTNIARLLVKPFSRELLVATVVYVLSHWEEQMQTEKSVNSLGTVLMRGNTDVYTISNSFRFIEQEKLTGILRASIRGTTVHAFCKEGVVRVITTRDVDVYLRGTPFDTPGSKSPFWKKCEEKQRYTLSPFLLNMSLEGVLPAQTAQTLTYLYGHRLFAQIWSENSVSYEFEQTALPPFVDLCHPVHQRADHWLLENLRNVDSASEIQAIIDDPNGIPTFTPIGYRQLRECNPRKDEWQILSQITGDTPLSEICRRLRIRVDTAARKIFYYQRLGFLDYWPSQILQGRP